MLALVTLTVVLAAAAGIPDPVLDEDGVRPLFAALLDDAQGGMSAFEQAVFVVRMPSGRFAFVRWPEANIKNESRWIGRFPPGVVAIAHTHPNWLPKPSEIDIRLAASAGVAVYVITRHSIMKTQGGFVWTVAMGEWSK